MLEFIVNINDLKKLFKKLSIAISTEDNRYYLKSVLFEKIGDEINFVASDGHKMVIIDAVNNDDCKFVCSSETKDFAYVLPRLAIDEFLQPNKVKGLTVFNLKIYNKNIVFDYVDVIKTYKLLDVTFPQWRKVAPSNETIPLVQFNKNYLKQICGSLSDNETIIFETEKLETAKSSPTLIKTSTGARFILMPVRL